VPWRAFAAENTDTLEEIIVTAEKREESAQRTPVAMNLYSSEQLAQAGVHDIATLSAVDPSVNFTASAGAAYIAVRGIASTDLTEIGDPAVPIARDGFFTNRSYGLFSSFYDVDRVEVLKGPQGTLYGRNSTGGLINVLTRRPGKELGGYASADFGNYGAVNLEGAFNLPLGDMLALRVSGASRNHDGYRDNSPQPRGDDEDAQSLRVQLAFQPGVHFSGLLSVQRDVTGGVGDVQTLQPYGQAYSNPDSSGWTMPTPYKTNLAGNRYRLELKEDGLPGGLTLSYLGGYDTTRWQHQLNATGTAPGSPAAQFIQEENPDTWNHELRLSSDANSALFWQAGLFYFSEQNSPLDSGLIERSGQFNDDYLIHFQYDTKTTSKAAFGQVGYRFNDAWKLSAGARYTREQKQRVGNANLDLTVASGGFLWSDTTVDPFAPIPVFLCTPACAHFHVNTPGNGDVTDSKLTWHLGLDWTPTPTTLAYAKLDTGFKSGGFNSNGSAPSVSYGPETVTALEVGTKNRFLANAAAFAQDYKGYQASQFTPALGGGPGVQNAGNARIYGLEGEFIGSFGAAGRFNANVAWLNARFRDFQAINSTGTAQVSLSGYKLPNAPDLSATMGYEREFIFGSGATLTPRVDAKYSSKYYYSFFNFEDTSQGAYTVANLSLAFQPASKRWQVQAYLRNATDTVAFSHADRNDNVHGNAYEFIPPRTYGLKLSAHW